MILRKKRRSCPHTQRKAHGDWGCHSGLGANCLVFTGVAGVHWAGRGQPGRGGGLSKAGFLKSPSVLVPAQGSATEPPRPSILRETAC